jgi:ribosomal protein S18 acetylase RimI-like enzyme
MSMTFDIKILKATDQGVLGRVAQGVFDHDVDATLASALLQDPRHYLAVAIDDRVVIGFASAVHYLRPDKPAELWINEVGVAPAYRGRGIGKALLTALLQIARDLKCKEAWVLTDRSNERAVQLYRAVGGQQMEKLQFGFDL